MYFALNYFKSLFEKKLFSQVVTVDPGDSKYYTQSNQFPNFVKLNQSICIHKYIYIFFHWIRFKNKDLIVCFALPISFILIMQ